MIVDAIINSKSNMNVVVLDNSEVVGQHFKQFFSAHPAVNHVDVVMNHQYYLGEIIQKKADVLLLNRSFHSDGFQQQIRYIRETCPQLVIIVCVDDFSLEYKEQCIKAGAHFVFDRLNNLSELNEIIFKIQGLIK